MQCSRHEVVPGRGRGIVSGDSDSARIAECLRCLGDLRLAESGDDHAGALVDEPTRRREAETSAPTGHDVHAVLKTKIHDGSSANCPGKCGNCASTTLSPE